VAFGRPLPQSQLELVAIFRESAVGRTRRHLRDGRKAAVRCDENDHPGQADLNRSAFIQTASLNLALPSCLLAPLFKVISRTNS